MPPERTELFLRSTVSNSNGRRDIICPALKPANATPRRYPNTTARRYPWRAMKSKLLRLLSAAGLILAALASLDLTGYTALLPPDYAGKALAAGLLVAALRDTVMIFGDIADDGERNNSWHPLIAAMLAPLALLAVSVLLVSCVTSETVTTAPDGTVTRQKVTAPSGDAIAAGVAIAGKVIAEK